MIVPAAPTIGFDEKLERLRNPSTFPDRPDAVELVETHFACVFLSRQYAYKLKKPIRTRQVDFTTIEERRANCETEVVLNRRLAETTYLGVVPLCISDAGITLEGDGTVIDWLVKMVRLPGEKMLDRVAAERREAHDDLVSVIRKLCRYYSTAERAPWKPEEYPDVLARQTEDYGKSLTAPALRVDQSLADTVIAMQLDYIWQNDELLASRVEAGRVVDAHGDLRPEHICLVGPDPQIIDCLEFSSELRQIDTAEEIAFLDLECERLGRADLGMEIAALYRSQSGDTVEDDLYGFYRGQRALIRALLSAWHLEDGLRPDEVRRWSERAEWYLQLARSCLEAPKR